MRRNAVMIAEDDAPMRALLALAVTRAGLHAVECGNGTELVELLEEARRAGDTPAMVLSDQYMPGRTGIEIASRLRGWGWDVPVVLVTAFPSEELRMVAARCGVDVVLAKPITLARVLSTILRLTAPPVDVDAAFDPYCDLGGSD